MKNKIICCVLCVALYACNNEQKNKVAIDGNKKNIAKKIIVDTIKKQYDTLVVEKESSTQYKINDSLNSISQIIAGSYPVEDKHFSFINHNTDFKIFSHSFTQRWLKFDSTRLKALRLFQGSVLGLKIPKSQTLFYPFSGPDALYLTTFFPDASNYVMVGLEPVGSLPNFTKKEIDSVGKYFNKVNTSLSAILNYSFFRTKSMKEDLRNEDINGTIHLLLLFLHRLNNKIVDVLPVSLDTLGNKVYHSKTKRNQDKASAIEIKFLTAQNKMKQLTYFSFNVENETLKRNKGFLNHMKQLGDFSTYLKGASYLLHNSHFSNLRTIILENSNAIVQDDSGIPYKHFESGWSTEFYGDYEKPIPMFSKYYQRDLDSVWEVKGTKKLGFGIGYNFRDKNSNLMLAVKQKNKR